MTTLENVQLNTNHSDIFPILMNLKDIVNEKELTKVSINVQAKIEKAPGKSMYYIFTIDKELHFDEIESTVDTFRLEYHKETNNLAIFISSENYYYILEDVSLLFNDINSVLKECIRQDETKYVSDNTEEFIEYWNTPEDERLD